MSCKSAETTVNHQPLCANRLSPRAAGSNGALCRTLRRFSRPFPVPFGRRHRCRRRGHVQRSRAASKRRGRRERRQRCQNKDRHQRQHWSLRSGRWRRRRLEHNSVDRSRRRQSHRRRQPRAAARVGRKARWDAQPTVGSHPDHVRKIASRGIARYHKTFRDEGPSSGGCM